MCWGVVVSGCLVGFSPKRCQRRQYDKFGVRVCVGSSRRRANGGLSMKGLAMVAVDQL